jgi:Phosphodiester glycosidase
VLGRSAADKVTAAVPSRSRADAERLRARRRRNRRTRRIALAAVVSILAIPGWSLGRALAANTTDPLSVRVVEWARDHRLGGLVGAVERSWYAHHQPPTGGTPKGGIPRPPIRIARARPRLIRNARPPFRPSNIRPLVTHPLPNEGVWQPTGRLVNGRPALWVTYLRPDALHTSLLAGVAYLPMSHLTATLHAGTDIPGGGPWTHGAQIATADYPSVVATFNSAFRLDNSGGGYYAEGRMVRPLVADRASLVTYANGRVDVGLWGRDDVFGASVTAVRQNLGLIVDGGALVPGLADANSSQWGGTVGNHIYVWRSGVGVDAHGNLVYAAGPGLNVQTLAEIMRRAGCVRAMELDINSWWVSFVEYTPDGHRGLQPSNLLPSMVRSPDRYMSDGTRDFIEIDARR